jgi:amino acid permease
MSKEYQLEEEDEGNVTSPEKASDEEVRNFKEEPGDDDGENRNPTVRNSMLFTSLLVLKGMIGAGILNLPLIFKTFGIIGGSVLSFLLTIISIFVAYLLGRSKDISQRYSFAVYSKITMGVTGSVLIKVSLFVMCLTLAIVQLIVFGDVLKGLSLLFCNINVKFLIVGIAIILLPFMFQKDISGVTKIAHFGIIGLTVFCLTTIVLFIYKYLNNKIIYEPKMLYPNGSLKELFVCAGGYYNAFTFHMSYFSYYLPLKPRNNKTMMKSVIIGSILTAIVYSLYGILFFLMYGDKITDSALKYLQTELDEANKSKDTKIVILLAICFLSFLVNASISTMIHFYLGKSHFIGLVKFILKKLSEKNEKKDIPLVDIKDDRKFSDDVQSIRSKKESEEILSERKQLYITFALYMFVLTMAITFEKIIILDGFNGAIVANYINLIAPSIFFFYFARKKALYGEKLIALFNFLFGFGLILMYIILHFF